MGSTMFLVHFSQFRAAGCEWVPWRGRGGPGGAAGGASWAVTTMKRRRARARGQDGIGGAQGGKEKGGGVTGQASRKHLHGGNGWPPPLNRVTRAMGLLTSGPHPVE